jgi:hypothetical protein
MESKTDFTQHSNNYGLSTEGVIGANTYPFHHRHFGTRIKQQTTTGDQDSGIAKITNAEIVIDAQAQAASNSERLK